MESVKAFYLMGEGFRESRLYEMRMLCREFFPGAEIRQEPLRLEYNLERRNVDVDGEEW